MAHFTMDRFYSTLTACLFLAVVNVGFGRPSVTVNESDGEFMMCVLKDRETVFPVEVTISTSSDTATEGEGKKGGF